MICPTCGKETPAARGRCASCNALVTVLPPTRAGVPPPEPDTRGQPVVQAATTFSGAEAVHTAGFAGDAPAWGPGTTGAPETDGTSQGGVRGAGPLSCGQAFGPRYHIIKLLGAGGMGAVYQAWDGELGVAVALKVIRVERGRGSASSDAEKRFKNELLLARQVTHKNVVRIHDLGEIDGIKYITMPYVEGNDLAMVLRREGKLPVARALLLARQIAAGLEAAHEAGVVHRDLKPANVMIGTGGDDVQALIMDFGISASSADAASGGIIGTLEYMAPEQAAGGMVDARADIYAFGVILYEMLVGPRPEPVRTAQDRIAAMRRRCEHGFAPVRSIDESIAAPLDALVTRCLERDPAARYQTTADLSRALAALDDAGELIPIPARITKRMMAALALLAVALVGGMYFVGQRFAPVPVKHEPVSVLIADITNGTGDAAFDHTLEPMLKLALENAGFISAYDRAAIKKVLGVPPPERLDERAAQQLAAKQGLGVVLSGSIERQGNRYGVALTATQAVTGNVIAAVKDRAATREQVLSAATKLAGSVRKALGDNTSDAAQRFAMETLSATSLEVVRDYAAAAMAMSNGRFEEARGHFTDAVKRDPTFGLAYAGLGISSFNLDKLQDAEKYLKEAVSHLDGMTERERYKTRGLFYMITGDNPQCVKEFGDMVARYAADASARNNLALCLTRLRNTPKAVDEMRQVVKILPKRQLYRYNLALYLDYSSDFPSGEQEAQSIQDPELFAVLAVAFAQLGQGRLADAAKTYQAIGKMDALGASYLSSGLGDLALYEGRFNDAARILSDGAAADLATKDPDRAASKFAALASVQVERRQNAAAIAAADKALANSSAVKTRFVAARVFVEAGAVAKARTLAEGLAAELLAEPQAYGKIVEGEIALKNLDNRGAIKAFTDANALLDTWIGHFDLGRAFLGASRFTQADSEFDRCITRRGEALALFLDEEPTYGYFPPVYYYQGRVREGLNNARFAESYRAYIDIRGKSTEDPLLTEARRRAGR
jgi:tetratricopeptide (TPR) repeat protein